MEPVRLHSAGGGLAKFIGESDPDFEQNASTEEQEAVRRAKEASGVIEVDEEFERIADAEQREARRQASLRAETKVQEQGVVTSSGQIRAKYKIEITFIHSRKLNGENSCGIHVWESGHAFHGGGDQLAFFCYDLSEKDPNRRQGCGGVISADDIRRGVAFCRHCQKAIVARKLAVWYYMKQTPQVIAEWIAKMFRQLDSSADIYLKFHKTDIRYIAMVRAKGPEKARKLKGMHIYPLHRILRDSMNGADLTGRFKAFITS